MYVWYTFSSSLKERHPAFHITVQLKKEIIYKSLWMVREQYQNILCTVIQHAAFKTTIEIPV